MSITDTLKTSRTLAAVKSKLVTLKAVAENKRAAEVAYKEAAADVFPDLLELDGTNGSGVRFEYEGAEFAGYVCAPVPERIWDPAPLVEYLKEKGYFDSVSVTVVDPEKLESEMAAGNIKREELDKFQIEKPRTPYLKIINPKPDSK